MIPMSLKQRIALAIKAKQNAAQQGMPGTPPSTQPLSTPSTMTMNPSSVKPIFAQGANQLNQGKFFKIKKKLGY